MVAVQRNSFPPSLLSSRLQLTYLIWLGMNLAGEKGKKNIPTVKYTHYLKTKKKKKPQGARCCSLEEYSKKILVYVCPIFTPFPRNLLMATRILNQPYLYQIQCIHTYLLRGFFLFILTLCTDKTESIYHDFHKKLQKIYKLLVYLQQNVQPKST